MIRKLLLAVAGLTLLVLGYGVLIEPHWLRVSHVRICSPGLGAALAGKKVVQISDMHSTRMGPMEEKVLAQLEEIRPDLILLTGDYVGWREGYGAALSFFSRLKAPLGIYAIMGDYDCSNDRQSCLFCHEPGSGQPTRRHPVHFLRNRVVEIAVNGHKLRIAGAGGGGETATPEVVDKLTAGGPLILLTHSPAVYDWVPTDRECLCLAGDTHGGQVWLPGPVWRTIGYRKCARYKEGMFQRGKATLYVSRGIGTSHLPVRILEPPELVVFEFQPGKP